jgi:hypothetical protein
VVVDAEKKEQERKRKRKTLLSEKRSVLKKSLTGPALLEMSGYAEAHLKRTTDLGLPSGLAPCVTDSCGLPKLPARAFDKVVILEGKREG